MVRLAQTMHLPCAETNTISKQTETSFHLTYIYHEYHRVFPKWFPCPWYIRRKLCTYLALRLTLSPNKLKCSSTWSTPPGNTNWCVRRDFRAHGTFGETLHLSCLEINTNSKRNTMSFHLTNVTKEVRSGVPKPISMPMVHSAQTVHLSCA
jgi:hypothetical protein